MGKSDLHYMKAALALAKRGLGRTWPNPTVGCVIEKDSRIIARARTADRGRPHAESIALKQAGHNAQGATLYVTLEPCAHHGKTPPCINAIIKAKPKRVVIGALDPDPRTNGKGILKLKSAGIDVKTGVLEQECQYINAGFFNKLLNNRPFITLKTACTLDGKIATKNDESKWITGDLARQHVHTLRAQNDAILTGIGTVLADNPMLTTRIEGIQHESVRIILDGKLETPLESLLVKSGSKHPLWIFYIENNISKQKELEKAGVRLFQIQDKTLKPILKILASEGITRLLVEGGTSVYAHFIKENLFDEFYVYRAPIILGKDAYSAISDLDIEKLTLAPCLSRRKTRVLGQDMLEIYRRAE